MLPGKTKAGVKYKGTVEVPNLSDENDMEDLDVSVCLQTQTCKTERLVKKILWWRPSCGLLQISVSLNKDEPETSLLALMRTKGADKIRETLGTYVSLLKTGITLSGLFPAIHYNRTDICQTSYQSKRFKLTSYAANEGNMFKSQSSWNITCNCAFLKQIWSSYSDSATALRWSSVLSQSVSHSGFKGLTCRDAHSFKQSENHVWWVRLHWGWGPRFDF